MIHDILQALGLVFVIEGLLYAGVPSHVKAMLARLGVMSEEQLRTAGVTVLGLGVLLVWLAKKFVM